MIVNVAMTIVCAPNGCEKSQKMLEKLEKWITIANICRFLKNYNGVLQIMSAFATTSVFRLK